MAAIATFDQARRIQAELYRLSPSASAQKRLASTCLNLALAHRSVGQRAEAVQLTRQARDLLEPLVKTEPGNFHHRRALAGAYRLLASAVGPAEALPLAKKAHDLLVRLCELEPGAAALQGELAASHRLLGHIYIKMDRKREALAEYEKALAVLEPVARRHPEMTDFQNDLARCHFDLGVTRWQMGRSVPGLESLKASRDINLALVKANPHNAGFRTALGLALVNMSGALADLGRRPEALEAARASVQEYQTVFAAAPQFLRYRKGLTHALKVRVRFSLENHLPAEAVRTALELKKLWPGNGRELYEVAQILAHATRAAKDSPQADHYAELSVASLREAAEAGLPKGTRPGDDPVFASFRQRQDFQTLLATLAPEGKVRREGGSLDGGRRP